MILLVLVSSAKLLQKQIEVTEIGMKKIKLREKRKEFCPAVFAQRLVSRITFEVATLRAFGI